MADFEKPSKPWRDLTVEQRLEYVAKVVGSVGGTEAAKAPAAVVESAATKDKGDWRIYYQYQLVEQDAVFTPVVQDEFILATNFKGHVFGAKYQLTKQIQLHTWALVAQRDQPIAALGQTDQSQWKIRGDFLVNF